MPPFELTWCPFKRISRGSGFLRVASDRDELPFPVQLAILFKVYRVTLGLHSVHSLSANVLASASARKCNFGVSDGMDSSVMSQKLAT